MPHEMNEFTKIVSSTRMKNTTGFVNKLFKLCFLCSVMLFNDDFCLL